MPAPRNLSWALDGSKYCHSYENELHVYPAIQNSKSTHFVQLEDAALHIQFYTSSAIIVLLEEAVNFVIHLFHLKLNVAVPVPITPGSKNTKVFACRSRLTAKKWSCLYCSTT